MIHFTLSRKQTTWPPKAPKVHQLVCERSDIWQVPYSCFYQISFFMDGNWTKAEKNAPKPAVEKSFHPLFLCKKKSTSDKVLCSSGGCKQHTHPKGLFGVSMTLKHRFSVLLLTGNLKALSFCWPKSGKHCAAISCIINIIAAIRLHNYR